MRDARGQGADTICTACAAPMQRIEPWLDRCGGCGFLASTLTGGAGTGIAGLEQLRRANFEIMLDRLAAHGPLAGKRVLEVGSAWGWFLAAAARRGAQVHGIEPEAANAELARGLGLSVETGLFPQDLHARGPYDLVVFNDVLEHIPDPAAAMRAVEGLLASGGLAVVNLPSSRGTLYRIARTLAKIGLSGPYARLWQKDFPSPHLSYFDPDNLRAMVERHTALRRVVSFPLPSVMRAGLWPRIRSSHAGPLGLVMFAGVWVLSFALARLPADIHVAVFAKSAAQPPLE